MSEPNLSCPACDSAEVAVTADNTGEHYCHSVKTQDGDAGHLPNMQMGRPSPRPQTMTFQPDRSKSSVI